MEQQSVESADGRLRPDLVVRLVGGKNVVVDSKVAFNGYLEAMEAKDEPTILSAVDQFFEELLAEPVAAS